MDSIYTAFRDVARRHGTRPALLARREGAYVAESYAALDARVQQAAAALRGHGLGAGDRVGILSYNRPEWVVADLATHAIGGVVVPIYHTLTPEGVAYIVRDSSVKLLFAENPRQLRKIPADVPTLERVVLFEGEAPDAREDVSEMATFHEAAPEASEEITPATTRDDLATIVYTSGTTGEPKGVMLSHGNILFNVERARDRFAVTPADVYVSYLPLAHVFERSCGYYLMILTGAAIAFAKNMATLVKDVQAVEPTVLSAVPRAIEKAHDTAVREVKRSPRFQQWLVRSTMRCLGEAADRRQRGERVPLLLRARCAVLDKLVAAKFRNITGSRLRLIMSGGAPLDPKLARVLYVLGFNILEGYGLTETSPSISSTTVDDIALGTVGTPLPGVEVKLGDGDEILVRGPNVMLGYLNKPEATARAIDDDGYFHTGDCGAFDAQGHLRITGRIKDLIITSHGKNIASAPIEAALARDPLVLQAVACGDNRKSVTALLFPDPDEVVRLARELDLAADPENLGPVLEDERIRGRFQDILDRTNTDLAPYEKITRFSLLAEVPTLENGLLTPTLKLRRAKVIERYANEIEAMYTA